MRALAALHKELSEANSQLVDTLQVEQLIEANQQLVLAILSAQSDVKIRKTLRQNSICTWKCAKPTSDWLSQRLAPKLTIAAEQALEQQRNIFL